MSYEVRFPREELDARIERLRQRMDDLDLDGLIVFSPENIYYLIGLSHQGFFSPHILIVPRNGEMHLVMRLMEQAAYDAQVENAAFDGHRDYEESHDKVCEVVRKIGLDGARWGLEKQSLFSPLYLGENIQRGLRHAQWEDASYLIDEMRLIKSPLELDCVREASRITLAMMRAVQVVAREGITEREIAAEATRAMIQAGGEYPGFGPFIRSTPTMAQEHVTWTNYQLKRGDALFIELAGCHRRYHAPMGRLFFVGEAPEGIDRSAEICKSAFDAVVATIKPGVTAGEAYRAWQDVVDGAGLTHYQRHHCGYMVGLGFPPSWVGGSRVVGLRRDSPMVLKEGNTFHLLSWLVGCGLGDYLITDTACLTADGCEALQKFPTGVQVI